MVLNRTILAANWNLDFKKSHVQEICHAIEPLFHQLCGMWRRPAENKRSRPSTSYSITSFGNVIHSLKRSHQHHFRKKYVPMAPSAQKPHQTVTRCGWRGSSTISLGFSENPMTTVLFVNVPRQMEMSLINQRSLVQSVQHLISESTALCVVCWLQFLCQLDLISMWFKIFMQNAVQSGCG